MLTTADKLVLELVQCLACEGVRDVILCPGSRNAPLCQELSRRDDFTSRTVVDERSAAFVALGIARQTGRPVAAVCTSGTAPLNFAPAVAEAYYAGVPLVVVTADRPARFIDILDSQTIRQPGIYINYIKGECDLASPAEVADIVPDLIARATGGWPGPVHINVRIEEPIGALAEAPEAGGGCRRAKHERPQALSDAQKPALLAASRGILIVAGPAAPDRELQRSLALISSKPQVVVVQDAPSNTGLPYDQAIAAPDAFFAARPTVAPDAVISIGGAPVSAAMKRYLRSLPGLRHWSVGQPGRPDTYGALEQAIDAEPVQFLAELAAALPDSGDFRTAWLECWHKVRTAASEAITAAHFTALAAVRAIFESLPADAIVHLSNGMAVRYAQFAPYPRVADVACNRGVSGIDGCTSTALGAAFAAPERPVVLISGDMSAQYDMGALATRPLPRNFRMAVLANGGGNIFRHIAATRCLPCREECLAGPVNFPAEELCRAFGLSYFSIKSADRETIGSWLAAPGPAILEIVTDGQSDADNYINLIQLSRGES